MFKERVFTLTVSLKHDVWDAASPAEQHKAIAEARGEWYAELERQNGVAVTYSKDLKMGLQRVETADGKTVSLILEVTGRALQPVTGESDAG